MNQKIGVGVIMVITLGILLAGYPTADRYYT